jgi:hypothetical protein
MQNLADTSAGSYRLIHSKFFQAILLVIIIIVNKNYHNVVIEWKDIEML